MQNAATRSDRLLELIFLSLRDRGTLCALVLAAYRVELTTLLDRVSSGSTGADRAATAGAAADRGLAPHVSEEDAFLVYDLAGRIAEAAGAARLTVIRRDALTLRDKAGEVHAGGERAARDMLAAGLKVIDRILDAARAQHAARTAPPSSTELN